MAELAIKIGTNVPNNDAHPQDGDIMCAFNNKQIGMKHAQYICRVTKVQFNSDGLNPLNCLTAKMLAKTSLYKFERVSRTEVKRINLDTLNETVFGIKPNANGEQINVEQYLYRRLNHLSHIVFGSKGREIWYGKHFHRAIDSAVVNDVWNIIETDTSKRRANYTLFPFAPREKQIWLVLKSDEFSNEESFNLTRPDLPQIGTDYRGKPIYKLTKFRTNKIDWENRIALPLQYIAEVKDTNKELDLRKTLSEINHKLYIEKK